MRSEQHNTLSINRGAPVCAARAYFYGYWFSRYGV